MVHPAPFSLQPQALGGLIMCKGGNVEQGEAILRVVMVRPAISAGAPRLWASSTSAKWSDLGRLPGSALCCPIWLATIAVETLLADSHLCWSDSAFLFAQSEPSLDYRAAAFADEGASIAGLYSEAASMWGRLAAAKPGECAW